MTTQHLSALRKASHRLDTGIPSRRSFFDGVQCPFPLRINAHAAAAERASLEWLIRIGLINSGQLQAKIAKAHLTTLVAGFYPTAGLAELQLASDYVCWAFALDDVGDETEVGERPARLMELFDEFGRLLNGEAPRTSAGSLERGLFEVVERVSQFMSGEQLARFAEGNRAYFGGMLWEANNRAHSQIPDEAAYLLFRPAAGAVPSFFELIEPLERIALAPHVRAHDAVQQLGRLAGGIICWINDVLSYEKERSHGDFHNLVMVYEHHRKLLPGAAGLQALAFINSGIRDFVAAAARLPRFGEAQDQELQRYVGVLQAVIRVTLSWTYDSTRYRR
ncbi:MAG: hypothetical protein ABJB12_09350 [Pseudomonadota bacterium]